MKLARLILVAACILMERGGGVSKLIQLPHNLEAERAVLGACLLDNQAIAVASGLIEPQDFFLAAHRKIFSQVIAMSEAGQAVDLTTLAVALGDAREVEASGGAAYLASLVDGVPRVTNVEHYAKIVREKSKLRELYHLATTLQSSALEGQEEAEEILDRSLQAVHTLAGRRATPDGKSFHAAAVSLLKSFDSPESLRIFTDHAELDDKIGGFRAGELVVYTAETGVGKTLLAQQTRRRACRDGWHALVASAEMRAESLVARELATEAQVRHWKMRQPEKIDAEEMGRLLAAAARECQTCDILDGEITLRRIRAKARRMSREGNLGLVIVDYDELVEAPGGDELEQQRNLVIGMKELALELNIPVILISQLRKSLQGEERKRPTLQRIYGSGAKSKHPSIIVYVDREWVRELKGKETEARICVLKNRDGRLGQIDAYFNLDALRFEVKPPSETDSIEDV